MPTPKVQGFSRSLWKSLAVKSIRLGWPTGGLRSYEALGRSINWRDLLLCQVFEDVWPSREQLPDVLDEVERRDFAALCARETHHSRPGLTDRLRDLVAELDASPWNEGQMRAVAMGLGLPWLGPRALYAFTYWWRAGPPSGHTRTIDRHLWTGVPPAVADMHTSEGRRAGTLLTILCGAVEGHLWLAKEVQMHGWQAVRARVHLEEPLPGEQRQGFLFGEEP